MTLHARVVSIALAFVVASAITCAQAADGSHDVDPLGMRAPVFVLMRADLDRTGLVSLGDILQQLPNSGGAINEKSNPSGNFAFPADGSGISAGAIEADLRYLGSKRVLVLVDGLRWVNGASASGISAATDLNTIPLSMIERIEVFAGGASPVYGSDAIGGVINIITRRHVDGMVANAYVGGYDRGDGSTQNYDVSWGHGDDRKSAVFGISFLDQQRVESGDRAISDSPIPGLDHCEAGCSSATPQGRVAYFDPIAGNFVDVALNDGVDGPSFPSDYHAFSDADRYNFASDNLVLTPSQRISVFGLVNYEFDQGIRLSAKAVYTNRQSLNQAAPEPLFLGPFAGNGNRLDNIAIDATNPYNPFGFTFDPSTIGYFITRRPVEAGPRRFEQDVDTFSVSGSLDGHFDWGGQPIAWDVAVSYGINRAKQTRRLAFNSARLEQALGPAYQDAGGVWRCGSIASPGDPHCVPFNIFGGMGPDGAGTITQEMLDYATFTEKDTSEQRQYELVASLSGNLVKLPAGYLAATAGIEYRGLSGSFDPDPELAAGNGTDVAPRPAEGHYGVGEAYGELLIPLVEDLFDLDVAGRYSDYSSIDPQFTRQLGVRWKPTPAVMLHVNYGHGMRAPSIGELYGGKSHLSGFVVDPCSDFNRPEVTDATRQRCIQLGVPSDGSYVQQFSAIPTTTGGNRNLTAEHSREFDIDLSYGSQSLDLDLSYFDLRLQDSISSIDAQLQLDRCVAGDDSLCQGIHRTARGRIASVANLLQNIGGIEERGFDLLVKYRMSLQRFGSLNFISNSSYLRDFWENVPTASHISNVKREGTLGGLPERAFPHLKSSLVMEWLYGGLSVDLTTRYISHLREQCRDLADFAGTCSDPDPNDDSRSANSLPSTIYNDLQVHWSPAFDHKLAITAGIINLFNVGPPVCYSCAANGFNPATYEIPGMFGYVSAMYSMN